MRRVFDPSIPILPILPLSLVERSGSPPIEWSEDFVCPPIAFYQIPCSSKAKSLDGLLCRTTMSDDERRRTTMDRVDSITLALSLLRCPLPANFDAYRGRRIESIGKERKRRSANEGARREPEPRSGIACRQRSRIAPSRPSIAERSPWKVNRERRTRSWHRAVLSTASYSLRAGALRVLAGASSRPEVSHSLPRVGTTAISTEGRSSAQTESTS